DGSGSISRSSANLNRDYRTWFSGTPDGARHVLSLPVRRRRYGRRTADWMDSAIAVEDVARRVPESRRGQEPRTAGDVPALPVRTADRQRGRWSGAEGAEAGGAAGGERVQATVSVEHVSAQAAGEKREITGDIPSLPVSRRENGRDVGSVWV